jgi:hypothetical protein
MKNQSGISLLLTVVIIGAFSLLVLKGLTMQSLNSLAMTTVYKQGNYAEKLSCNCQEEALRQVLDDPDWQSADFSLKYINGSCQGSLGGAGIKQVSATGTAGSLNYNLEKKYIVIDEEINRYYD